MRQRSMYKEDPFGLQTAYGTCPLESLPALR
jgi:hypothetical protein